MVHYYDSISEDLQEWALSQQVFFIASAPLTGKHINVSPKGLPASTLSIFDGNHVGYIDATGSGIETVSHMYENGRATIMFCSFDQSPRIMRWFCTGRVVEWDHPDFDKWLAKMGKEKIPGTRAIILLDVWKGISAQAEGWSALNPFILRKTDRLDVVQTSCGYAVPVVSQSIDPSRVHEGPRAYMEDRKTLGHWAGNQVEKGTLHTYRQSKNVRSLDGCGGLRVARRQRGEFVLLQDGLIWLRRIARQWDAILFGVVLALVIMAMLRVVSGTLDLRVPSSIRFMG